MNCVALQAWFAPRTTADTIHGNALLAKPMTEGQFTSRNNDEFTVFLDTSRFFGLTIVSSVAYAAPNFWGYVTGFILCGYRSTPTVGWGTSNEVQAFRHCFEHCLCAVCLATTALAQSIFGTILGTVTDPSGAVVPNAVITVTNQGENISHEVRS